jgi:hypothetical protein
MKPKKYEIELAFKALANAYILQSDTIDHYHRTSGLDCAESQSDANHVRLHDTMRLISNAMSFLGYEHEDSREITAYWDLRRDS